MNDETKASDHHLRHTSTMLQYWEPVHFMEVTCWCDSIRALSKNNLPAIYLYVFRLTHQLRDMRHQQWNSKICLKNCKISHLIITWVIISSYKLISAYFYHVHIPMCPISQNLMQCTICDPGEIVPEPYFSRIAACAVHQLLWNMTQSEIKAMKIWLISF